MSMTEATADPKQPSCTAIPNCMAQIVVFLSYTPLSENLDSPYFGAITREKPSGQTKGNTMSASNLPLAFVAKMVAKSGQEEALAGLLTGALALANNEPGTVVWFAVRTSNDTFWIFDAFPDAAARDTHANGAIVAALMAKASELLAVDPEILPADVLAAKV